jgi:drug/metabolite transporter (DMT)-like permease
MKIANRESLGLLLGLVAVTIFGGTLPMTRVVLTQFDPVSLSVARGLIGGLVAALVLVATRQPIPGKGTWLRLGICAAVIGLGFQIFSALGSVSVPSAHGGVVLGLLPLTTASLATWLSGERPSPAFWICSVLGAVIVVAYALRQGGGGLEPGDLWLVGAVLCASTGYTLSAQLARAMPAWVVISWSLALTLPVTAVLSLWLWPTYLGAVDLRGWTAFTYLTLFSQYLGFFAWNSALAMGGTARVSQVQLLQTFITIGLAALLAGERIDVETVVCAVAIVGLLLLSRRFRVARHPAK